MHRFSCVCSNCPRSREFLSAREIGHHATHELEKLNPPLLTRRLRMDGTCSDFQGRKQIQGAVSLIGALETADDFSLISFYISCLSLQRFRNRPPSSASCYEDDTTILPQTPRT